MLEVLINNIYENNIYNIIILTTTTMPRQIFIKIIIIIIIIIFSELIMLKRNVNKNTRLVMARNPSTKTWVVLHVSS